MELLIGRFGGDYGTSIDAASLKGVRIKGIDLPITIEVCRNKIELVKSEDGMRIDLIFNSVAVRSFGSR